jgi:hypothetical protein
MDYLKRSASISQMDGVRNETIRIKNWNEKRHIPGNRRTAIKMVRPRHVNGGLQNC